MITVDGEPVITGPDPSDHDEATRLALLELKLYKALAALSPPHDLSSLLHARVTEAMRTLKKRGVTDPGARAAADLTDDELHQAAALVRAMQSLPSWTGIQGYYRPGSFRAILSSYALDLDGELSKRAGHRTRVRSKPRRLRKRPR